MSLILVAYFFIISMVVVVMSKGKVFPLKIDSANRAALKESAHKHVNEDQTKVRVIFGLNSDFMIAIPCVYKEGMFVNIRDILSNRSMNMQDLLQECKRNNTAIYYPFNTITYVCEHTIFLNRGVVDKHAVRIFLPSQLVNDGLECNDVSRTFPVPNRGALANSCLNYSLSRV